MSIKNAPGKEEGEFGDLCVKTINNVVVAIISTFRNDLNEQGKQQISGDTKLTDNSLKELSQQITDLSRKYLKNIPATPENANKIQKSPSTSISRDQSKKFFDRRRSTSKSDANQQSKKNNNKMSTSQNEKLSITSKSPSPNEKVTKSTDPRKELKSASLTLSEGPVLTIVKPDDCIIPPVIKEYPEEKDSPCSNFLNNKKDNVCSILLQTADFCRSGQTQTCDTKAECSIKSIQAQVETTDSAQETEGSTFKGSNATQTAQATEDDKVECGSQDNDAVASLCLKELLEVDIQTDEDDEQADYFPCNEKENICECSGNALQGVDSCGCMSGYNREYFAIANRLDQTEKRLQEMWTKMFAITRTLKDHIVHCADVDNIIDVKKPDSS